MEEAPQTEDPFFEPYGEKFWQDYTLEQQREAGHSIGRILYGLCDFPKTVLDVGCGPGHILFGLREKGSSVFGIESDSGIHWCLKLGIMEIDLYQRMGWDLRGPMPVSVPKAPFDLVVCTEVAEHLPSESADEMIRWICKDLNPKWFVFSGAVCGRGGTAHINEQSTPVWMRKIRQHGTHVVDWERSEQLHQAMKLEKFTFSWVPNIYLWRRRDGPDLST